MARLKSGTTAKGLPTLKKQHEDCEAEGKQADTRPDLGVSPGFFPELDFFLRRARLRVSLRTQRADGQKPE